MLWYSIKTIRISRIFSMYFIVGTEPARNSQDKIYGLRLTYDGHSFKASEIRCEFVSH